MFKIPPEAGPMMWGAVGGAAALAIVGFTWGGWTSASTAEARAAQRVNAAVVQALAPICADSFRKNANATANLAEMQKMQSWDQGKYLVKGGWATMPGATEPNSAVADACVRLLEATKS